MPGSCNKEGCLARGPYPGEQRGQGLILSVLVASRDGSWGTEKREIFIFHCTPFVTFAFVPCLSINYSKNKVKWEKNKSF